MVLICHNSSDELDLCPVQLIQTHIAGPAYISGIRVLRGNDPVKLLLKKFICPPQMPTMSQRYMGAVRVNTRQAKRMAGAAHSN